MTLQGCRRILDLGCPGTWHPDLGALLSDPQARAKIRATVDAGEAACHEFLHEFDKDDSSVRDAVAVHLRREALDILRRRYAHVVAYHGCRPMSVRSYEERGILPSSTAGLIEQARELFEGIGGLDDILREMEERYPTYLAHNEGKVWLLLSGNVREMPGCDHHEGSELIRVIADRLGDEAEDRFGSTGEPTLIKCAIPVAWLNTHTMPPMASVYANAAIAAVVRSRMWPAKPPKAVGGGFALTRSVPPEKILEVIDIRGT